MPELAIFQDAFATALRTGAALEGYGDPARLQPGLSVYRNTIFKGALDALAANYPTVERLVGRDWFCGSANAYLEIGWPHEPSLVAFGEFYPDFLLGFAPAEELPYLPGVARLDRWWTEAHVAPDAPVLGAEALAQRAPEALLETRLRLHPSVRFGWFTQPSPTIWRLNRPFLDADDAKVVSRAEGALLARPHGRVEAMVLDPAGFAFLDTCHRGGTAGAAAVAALAVDPEADLPRRIAEFISLGAFLPEEPA